jgi:hypothetical protein
VQHIRHSAARKTKMFRRRPGNDPGEHNRLRQEMQLFEWVRRRVVTFLKRREMQQRYSGYGTSYTQLTIESALADPCMQLKRADARRKKTGLIRS